jgi:hypothetical protein
VLAVHRPVSVSCGWGAAPPFIGQGGGSLTYVPHYFYTCCGMANSVVELMAVLTNPAPVTTSWRVLCLNRGDFEGGGVVVDRGAFRRARGSC